MPPRVRKEPPSEPVIYPASKRKAPAFKAHRVGKMPRTEQTGQAETVLASGGGFRKASGLIAGVVERDRGAEDVEKEDEEDEEGDLDDDPLVGLKRTGKGKGNMNKGAAGATVVGAKSRVVTAATGARARGNAKAAATASSSSRATRLPPSLPSPGLEIFSSPPPSPNLPHTSAVPPLSQSDEVPTLPRPLLLRLLHEGFADKSTKIDKHAVQVLQKYMEVFVREAIARAALSKREAAERGEADEADKAWLELEDLEKIAPGMLLDF
nr:centromere protein x [Quercus suber]